MLKRITLFMAFIALAATTLHAQSSNIKRSSIRISYMYAFGKAPKQDELNYWMGQPTKSIAQYLDNHRGFLRVDDGYKTEAIRKSYLYSFGRVPNDGEVKYWKGQNQLFCELNRNHLQWLRSSNTEWMETVARAFIFAFNTTPNDRDLTKWSQGTRVGFMTLVDKMEATKGTSLANRSSYRVASVNGTNISTTTETIPSQLMGQLNALGEGLLKSGDKLIAIN